MNRCAFICLNLNVKLLTFQPSQYARLRFIFILAQIEIASLRNQKRRFNNMRKYSREQWADDA